MNLEFRKSLRRKKSSTVPPPTVERDVNAEINLKGWLYRLEGSPLKHWKKRWCVLAQHALFVYKDEDEQKLLCSVLLPGYNVRVCTSHDRVSHKNAFVAEHSQMKSFYFAADSNAAMCQWRNSMARAATVQTTRAPEHISPPPQAVYERDNGRYLAMTCVTLSPIYANAPPKPKRHSPPSNRPRSADFLNERDDPHRMPQRRPEARPHTSMRMFDPSWGAPAPPRRPKSCLAEPMFSDASYRLSPGDRVAVPQDIYGSLQQPQPQILHPAAVRPCHGRLGSPSTSASSTPPPSFNRHANFHNSSECYSPPQANFSSLAHSLNSLSRPLVHPHQRQQQHHQEQQANCQLPYQARFRPELDVSRSTNDIMASSDSLRVASPYKKPPSGRTISSVSSINGLDEIQPSKLEMFRQVPQPSYTTTKPLYDWKDFSLRSSRDLQSLQSLTDSQYSTAPPESSLPSLESNSDVMMVIPSPVQHFTNVPPAQLRMQSAYSPKLEARISPPKYSEACLRSELVQRMNSTGTAPPNFSSKKQADTSPQSQHRCSTPTRPNNSNRKLLFDKITCSPVKTPLAEKNQPEEPYSYGREDLLKASEMFYGHNGKDRTPTAATGAVTTTTAAATTVTVTGHSQPVGTALDSRLNLNSLDISFQSSSHNSVFEHDRDAAPTTMLPIMSQMDRTNYAILKQEIEGSKVLDTNNNTSASRNGFRSASESVSSNNSQNSIVRNNNSARSLSPESSTSVRAALPETADPGPPRQGTVSAKLAFFESKTSPETSCQSKSILPSVSRNNSVGSSNNGGGGGSNINKVPDLIDELKETSNKHRLMSNFMTTASSEDILKTITANKHQRSLSLLEGPAPDVVPTQSPPYYYSDLSLSARSSSRDSLRESVAKCNSTTRKHESNREQQDSSTKHYSKSQSCENLLKKQSLQLPEITQSASCLLDCEPFYENIGFGCKSSAVKGPEPQSSPAKISFLAASSTQAQKTASVDELNTGSSKSSQESLSAKSTVIREFCGFFETSSSPVPNHRSLGPPDLVQSTLNSSADHGNEIFAQIINSIKRPSKIDIPERYVSESDSEADFSAVERLARYQKADTIRRRIAGQSRDQANRLTVNQVIAKQAKHVSKIVAAQQ